MTAEEGVYVQNVVKAVKAMIGHEPWFRGVCTDTIYDSFLHGRSIKAATEIAHDDTLYWDGQYL